MTFETLLYTSQCKTALLTSIAVTQNFTLKENATNIVLAIFNGFEENDINTDLFLHYRTTKKIGF